MAHNERRRNNRKIKAAVIEAAARAGVSASVIDELRAAPPKVAKEWIEARGIEADRFLATDPPSLPQLPGPDEAARIAAAWPGGRHPAPPVGRQHQVADGADSQAEANTLSSGWWAWHNEEQARLAAEETSAPPVGEPKPQQPEIGSLLRRLVGVAHRGPDKPVPDRPLRRPDPQPVRVQEAWRTPELDGQLLAARRSQGVHRDERSLLAASVMSQEPIGPGTNETTRVKLDNGVVGYHKPFAGLNDQLAAGFGQDSAQQSLHEVAAWQLAREMGPPWSEIVPPVVVREIDGELGSFAVERPGSPGGENPRLIEHARLRLAAVPEWQSAAFFDGLIGQQDRHPMNYLIAGDRLALIDHGYTFARPGDYTNYSVMVDWRLAAGGAQLSHTETDTLRRLTSSPDLLGLESMLQKERANALRSRAERMLKTGRMVNVADY